LLDLSDVLGTEVPPVAGAVIVAFFWQWWQNFGDDPLDEDVAA